MSDAGDWLVLDADEEVIWSASPRLTSALSGAIVGVVAIAAGVVGAAVIDARLAVIAVVGLAPPAWSYLAVRNTRFVVTSEALYAKRGILGRHVRQVPLDRVQNSSFAQGIRGRFLGYGTVTFESAGGPGLRFHNIESPRAVRRLIDRRVLESNSVPGSLEQWSEIRAEVQSLREAFEDRLAS